MRTTTPSNLIRHIEKYYSDQNITKDLDAVLDCCVSEDERALVRKYAHTRKRAPGFRPGNPKAVSTVDEKTMKTIRTTARRLDQKRVVHKRRCSVCDGPMQDRRADTKVCSLKCDRRGRRARAKLLSSPCSHSKALSACQNGWCKGRVADMPKVLGPIPEGF